MLVLVGDSLTAHGGDHGGGWGQRLAAAFIGRCDVVNRGFSGYNSRWAALFAERLLQGLTPKVLVLWLGANDAVLSSVGSKQFVPVDEFGNNLSALVRLAREAGAEHVVVLTPPPVDEAARLVHQVKKYGADKATGVLERTQANTALYAHESRAVAERLECGVVDVFSLFVSVGLQPLLSDGLHLSPAGEELVFASLLAHLKERGFGPEDFQPWLPPHSEVATFPGRLGAALNNNNSSSCEVPSRVFANGAVWDWSCGSFVRGMDVLVSDAGRIVQVQRSSDGDTKHDYSALEVVDLNGQFMLPGLADAHIHVYHMGENQQCLNLEGCSSLDELKRRLAAFAVAHSDREWIVGVGWDHEKMGGVLPSRWDLDACVAPGAKVYLWRCCFHIGVASTGALQAGGVSLQSPPEVTGGAIDVAVHGDGDDGDGDGNGAPPTPTATGVLREGATDLVVGKIAEPSSAVAERYLADGLRECLEAGLTSVQTNDAGALKFYQALEARGELPIRVHMTATAGELGAPYMGSSDMLVCDRVKIFTDGALGADTAALRVAGGVKGILMHEREALTSLVRAAKRDGLRVECHAIGDAAAEAALDAFDAAGLGRGDRPVLTHAQVLGPDLIERMAAGGVVANVQPSFVPTDAAWVRARLAPAKLRWSYCWKTLVHAGVQVVGSSDCPVESCSPLKGMFDAIFRPAQHVTEPPPQAPDAAQAATVFLPEERLAFVQALQLYTTGAQFAAGAERRRGRIESGMDADFTVLDKDVAADPAQLVHARVTRVVVGGVTRLDKSKSEGDDQPPPPPRNNGPYARGKGGDALLRCRCPHLHF